MNDDNRQDSGRDKALPDWTLERYARDDLPPAQAAEVRRRLQETGPMAEDARRRLAALQRSDEEILVAHPPGDVAAEIHRRLARTGPARAVTAETASASASAWTRKPASRWSFALPTLALGAAGLVAVFAVGRDRLTDERQAGNPEPASAEAPEQTVLKGPRTPRLAIYRKQGRGRADRLASGALVRTGEQLQMKYVANGRRFGVVASVDARGVVSLHLPEAPGQAAALANRGETMLPHAFELDDSPGDFERFVFVSGDQPFSTEVVVEALRPGGPPLPPELTLVDLTLRKQREPQGDLNKETP